MFLKVFFMFLVNRARHEHIWIDVKCRKDFFAGQHNFFRRTEFLWSSPSLSSYAGQFSAGESKEKTFFGRPFRLYKQILWPAFGIRKPITSNDAVWFPSLPHRGFPLLPFTPLYFSLSLFLSLSPSQLDLWFTRFKPWSAHLTGVLSARNVLISQGSLALLCALCIHEWKMWLYTNNSGILSW